MRLNTSLIENFKKTTYKTKAKFISAIGISQPAYDTLMRNATCKLETLYSISKVMNLHPGELFEYEKGEEPWAGTFKAPEVEEQKTTAPPVNDDRIELLEEKVALKEETISMLREKVAMLEEKAKSATPVKRGYKTVAEEE